MKLPIGIDDYKELIEGHYLQVDKTLFIKDILDDGAKTVLITRPRRFAKTLNQSMLRYFFDARHAESNRQLFEGTKIGAAKTEDGQACLDHQGQYPVIFLTLKSIRPRNYKAALDAIWREVSNLYEHHRYLLTSDKLSQQQKSMISAIIAKKASLDDLQISLKYLSQFLSQHYDKKVIILLDEYDTPFHAAYTSREGAYHEDLIDFMKVFLGEAFKGNEYLFKGVITGILRISLMNMFSGVNNVPVRSMLSRHYAAHFGFTESELEGLFLQTAITYPQQAIKDWYNGYLVGGVTLYNPWSIVNCLDAEGETGNYWTATGEDSVLGIALREGRTEVRKGLLTLLDRRAIDVYIDERTIFADVKQNSNALWGLMVSSGYLMVQNVQQVDNEKLYTIAIPNKEVKTAFSKMIGRWFFPLSREAYLRLFNSIATGDMEGFHKIVQEYLDQSASFHDLGPKTAERFYHVFILGMFCVLQDRYLIHSNFEGGKGRPDIVLIPKNNTQSRAIIFEFKRTDNEEYLDTEVNDALTQITENRYRARLEQHDITTALHVGMAFCGKECRMAYEEHDYVTPQPEQVQLPERELKLFPKEGTRTKRNIREVTHDDEASRAETEAKPPAHKRFKDSSTKDTTSSIASQP